MDIFNSVLTSVTTERTPFLFWCIFFGSLLLAASPVYFFVKQYSVLQTWKKVVVYIFMFACAFYAISLFWNVYIIPFREGWWALVIEAITGGLVAAIFLHSKKQIVTFLSIMVGVLVVFFIILVCYTKPVDLFMRLPMHICDFCKIFMIIYIIRFALNKKTPSFLEAYIVIFFFLGSIAYMVIGMHLNEPIDQFFSFESIVVHWSYMTIIVFLMCKRLFKFNPTHSILNMIWISVLYIPFIFLNQIFNTFFFFNWRMTDHNTENSNPINVIYDLFKPWGTFEMGSYKSIYGQDASYDMSQISDKDRYYIHEAGQTYKFEINILFYIVVLGLTTAIIYGFTFLIKYLDKIFFSRLQLAYQPDAINSSAIAPANENESTINIAKIDTTIVKTKKASSTKTSSSKTKKSGGKK